MERGREVRGVSEGGWAFHNVYWLSAMSHLNCNGHIEF